MKICFTLPGRPKGKERPRVNSETGAVYTPKASLAIEREIAKAYKAAAVGLRPIVGPVKLTIIGVFAIPASWPAALRAEALQGRVWHVARGQLDLDNAIKLVSDALNKVAFVDDAQVAVLTCGKRFGHPERMEITVEALAQPRVTVTPGQRALEDRIAVEGWDRVLALGAVKKKSSNTRLRRGPRRA